MAVAAAPRPAPVGEREDVLALADGVELLGEFEGSGFREPPLLARRADGQIVQLTPLLYAVAAECDPGRDAEQVAAAVTARCGRGVSGGNVRFLVEERLRPLGVVRLQDGSNPEVVKRAPLMALRHRRPLLSERTVNALARPLTWLHRAPVVIVTLAVLALFDAWLFGIHGIAGGLRIVLYAPGMLLGVLAAIVVATAFHELGHASACRYGGARPGVMGVGLYLVWPAFYCDVTEAYRLGRAGRLRTDLGGVYFNGIFALLCGGLYFVTGLEALLLVAFAQHVIVLQQLLPLLRFDGYYVLSDLTGVPDILSRIKPIFRSLVRGRRNEPQVRELKSWVRLVVTAYLLLLIPFLALVIGSTVLALPRMLATLHDSLGLQLDRLGSSSGFAEAGVGVVRLASLCLPVGAMALSLGRTGRMAGRGLLTWSGGSVPRRALVTAGVVATAGAIGAFWWPNGEYEPLRPGERGTVGEVIASVPEIAKGRPSFTPAQEAVYGHAPTVREQHARDARRDAGRGDDAGPAPSRPATDEPGEDPVEGGAAPSTGDDGYSGDEFRPGNSAVTPTPTATPGSDATLAPSSDPAAPPAPTATPTATPSPTPTASATPTETARADPVAGGETLADEAAPTATSTPAPTPTPTPTPTP